MKLRILGPDGRQVGFAVRQRLVLETLRVLSGAKQGLKVNRLAARVAEVHDEADATSVSYVLTMLRRIGVVRRQRGAVYFLASEYSVAWEETRQGVRNGRARLGAKWEALDWTRTDRELARQLGYTRERIRQVRRELGMADSPFKRHSAKGIALREWLRRNRDRAGALNGEQIRAESGVTLGSGAIARYMRMEGIAWTGAGPPRPAAPPKYSLFNWDLPNHQLSRIWGSLANYVSRRRARSGHGPARWDGRSIHTMQGTVAFEEYRAALKAEQRKARARAQGLASDG